MTRTSVHSDCGALITWVPRDDDPERMRPPLEFVGNFLGLATREDGSETVIPIAAYDMHHCDPEKMIKWQEYKARVAEIKANAPDTGHNDAWTNNRDNWLARKEQVKEETWKAALTVKCPRESCGQAKNKKCLNLTIFKKTGEKIYIQYPHPERLKKATQ